MYNKCVLCVVTLVTALMSAGAAASMPVQETAIRGELVVTVSDSTGARVADALVTLTRGAERRRSTTGEDGTARFSNLAEAEWTVVVTRDGFAPWSRPLMVGAGSVDVPVGLAVAGLAETIQVES